MAAVEAVDQSLWQALLPLYLTGGILHVALNMRSATGRLGARELERHGLSWAAIPMILISAALWPLWLLTGLLIQSWLLRRREKGTRRDP